MPKDTIRALGEAGIYLPSLDKNSLKLKRDNPIVRALIVFRRVPAEVIDLEKIIRALHPDGKLHARYNPPEVLRQLSFQKSMIFVVSCAMALQIS